MKITKKQTGVLFFIGCALFLSCEKEKTKISEKPAPVTTEIKSGLPSGLKKLNGYFYASNRTSYSVYGNQAYYSYVRLAGFGDPGRSLLNGYNHDLDQRQFNSGGLSENVNVGNVTFNYSMLSSNSGGSYTQNKNSGTPDPNTACRWATEGNGSFVAIDLEVPRGFPKLPLPDANSSTTFTMSFNNDFTFNIDNSFSNYDSLCVRISNSSSTFSAIRKTFEPGVSSVTFTKAELQTLNNFSYGVLVVMAYNYSHKTESDKVYVFELSTKVERSFTVVN